LERQSDGLILKERTGSLEEELANRLRKQRDHLFTFLYDDHVDATNNLAERQLRPAVIARKVSCGNKTKKGAHTWEVMDQHCRYRQSAAAGFPKDSRPRHLSHIKPQR
jgi:hypothetical protein